MTLSIQVNGQTFEKFNKIRVRASVDTFARSFSFECASGDLSDYPIKVGDAIVISAGTKPVCTGFIDRIGASYDGSSAGTNHIVTVDGRSRTADVIDSSLVSTVVNFSSLSSIIEFILNELGVDVAVGGFGTGIKVVDEASVSQFGQFDTGVAIRDGENAFKFLEGLARKLQVLLTDDGEGNIVITRNEGRPTVPFSLTNKIGDTAGINNIKRANFALDISARYNKYFVKSQQSTVGINLEGLSTEPKDVADQSGAAIDGSIRAGRQLVVEAETPMNAQTAQARADWQANIDRARSLVANVTVRGHNEGGGKAFDVNQLVLYNDDFAGINQTMLIDGFNMTFDLDNGSETEFRLLPPDAYTIDPNTPAGENNLLSPLGLS